MRPGLSSQAVHGLPTPRGAVHSLFTIGIQSLKRRSTKLRRHLAGPAPAIEPREEGNVEQRTPSEVLEWANSEGVEIVDLRFCDLPGLMQHFSIPVNQLTADAFEDGYGFDGSSIRGFQEIQESDMLLFPDPNTAVIDPFRQHKTLNMNCFVSDPVTGESYTRDPRYVAQKAEAYLASTGIADTVYFGPEAEFFIFDDVRFHYDQHSASHSVDSIEAAWNTASRRGPEPRLQDPLQGGLFPAAPDGSLPGPAVGDDPDGCRTSASRSRSSTTRWGPPVRPRSTCGSTRCCAWPTSSCSTSTS